MFDLGSSEFLLAALIALLVIGPKDLPNVLRWAGRWVGKARSVAAQFRSGLDDMVRQSELKEMEQQWQAENDRIMREHPDVPDATEPEASDGAEAEKPAADPK